MVAPEADRQRHDQPGRGVHEHDQADLVRGILDSVEQDRQVAGRHRPAEAGAEGGRAEDEEVGNGTIRSAGGEGADLLGRSGHGATTASEAGSTSSVTGPVPRFVVSAMTGELPPVAIRRARRSRSRAGAAHVRAATEPPDQSGSCAPPFPREAHDVKQTVVRACLRGHPEPEGVQREVGDEELTDRQELRAPSLGRRASRPRNARRPERGAGRSAEVGRVGRAIVRACEGVEADAHSLDGAIASRWARAEIRSSGRARPSSRARRPQRGRAECRARARRFRAARGKDGELGGPNGRLAAACTVPSPPRRTTRRSPNSGHSAASWARLSVRCASTRAPHRLSAHCACSSASRERPTPLALPFATRTT